LLEDGDELATEQDTAEIILELLSIDPDTTLPGDKYVSGQSPEVIVVPHPIPPYVAAGRSNLIVAPGRPNVLVAPGRAG
jgi:hypothetical protein